MSSRLSPDKENKTSRPPSSPLGRVLLVDDDPQELDSLRKQLSHAGYYVLTATDARTALAAAAREAPDLVLVDLAMPGMSGLDVCTELKKDPTTSGTPIVILTSVGSPEDKAGVVQAGAYDLLSKPVDLRELDALVRHHLTSPHRTRTSVHEVGSTPGTPSTDSPQANLFDEGVLLPMIRNAIEKRDFNDAESNLRVFYANLADRIAAAYTENAQDLLNTIQENYAVLRGTEGVEPSDQPVFYLGQLKAAMELAKRLAQRTLPLAAVRVVMASEVAKQILERLHEDGPMPVTELAEKLNRAHPYISTLLGRLEAERIIRRRRFGQTVEVSLLPVGRELVLQLRKEREVPAPSSEGIRTIMEETEAQLFARLKQEHPEFRRLAEEHRQYDEKIGDLDRIYYQTAEQERKRKELEKTRLLVKEQMYAIMRRYRQQEQKVAIVPSDPE